MHKIATTHTWLATLSSALVVAALELTWTVAKVPIALESADVALLGVVCTGLLIGTGALALCALAVARFVCRTALPQLYSWLAGLPSRVVRRDDPDGSVVAALWVCAALGPATFWILVATTRATIESYRNPALEAVAVPAFNLLGALAGTLVGLAVWRLTRRAVRWLHARNATLASPRLSLVVLALLAMVAGITGWVATADLRRAIQADWIPLTIAFVASTLLLRPVFERVEGRRHWAIALATLSAVTMTTALVGFGWRQRVALTALTLTPASQHIAKGAIGLTDVDGDGHGVLFTAGDCAPFDDTRHPGAHDVPDDGIDQDCRDGDLASAAVELTDTGWSETRRPFRRHIILITVDALRADRLVAYGREAEPLAPNIDAFAARSTVFRNAYAPSGRSVHSITAMFAGRHAAALHWDMAPFLPGVRDQNVLLAERLAGHRYQTKAIVGTDFFGLSPGFYQGFQDVDAPPKGEFKVPSVDIVDRSVRFLEEHDSMKRFFLWVHLFDTHSPYSQRPGFGSDAISRYDGEVAHVDAQLGRLFTTIETHAPQAIVILASDHGEAFGAHGRYFHGRNLYDEVSRVPFVVHFPGAEPHVVETPVSLIDLVPTLLDLVDLRIGEPLSGRSLADAVVDGAAPAARPVFAELLPDRHHDERHRMVVDGSWKLLVNVHLGIREVYDLESDPGEMANLYDARRDVARELEATLRRIVDRISLLHTR